MPTSASDVARVNTFPVVFESTVVLGELIPVAVVSVRVGAVGWATTVAVALAVLPAACSELEMVQETLTVAPAVDVGVKEMLVPSWLPLIVPFEIVHAMEPPEGIEDEQAAA